MSTSTIEQIRERLATLAPERLDIRDDSHLHAGHAGAKDGGHYRLSIVSPRLVGLGLLARHRLIYQELGELMRTRIHALQIHALTPAEAAGQDLPTHPTHQDQS